MSENHNTNDTIELSESPDVTMEIELSEDQANDLFCRLEVPVPDVRDINSILIHIKHDLGFQASLEHQKNNP